MNEEKIVDEVLAELTDRYRISGEEVTGQSLSCLIRQTCKHTLPRNTVDAEIALIMHGFTVVNGTNLRGQKARVVTV